jgi:predicted nucleotidyltransferase
MDIGHPTLGLLAEPSGSILAALARSADGFSGRKIERLIDATSHSAVRRALAQLVEVGLVRTTEAGKAILYSLNRAHVLWGPLELMLESNDRIQEAVAKLAKQLGGPNVSLSFFGSVARGSATSTSDVDIALILPNGTNQVERDRLIDAIHERINLMTGNTAQVFDVTRDELTQMVRNEDPLVHSWRDDAITVTGPSLRRMLNEEVHHSSV